MDYVTSVELFIDLKPRICEVCSANCQCDSNNTPDIL